MYFLILRTKNQCRQSRKKNGFSWSRPFYCTTKRLAADVYIFPSRLKGLAALKIREILIINPTAFALLLRVSLSLPALNPGDFISSLLIHVFCGICFSDYDTFACTHIEAAQLMWVKKKKKYFTKLPGFHDCWCSHNNDFTNFLLSFLQWSLR